MLLGSWERGGGEGVCFHNTSSGCVKPVRVMEGGRIASEAGSENNHLSLLISTPRFRFKKIGRCYLCSSAGSFFHLEYPGSQWLMVSTCLICSARRIHQQQQCIWRLVAKRWAALGSGLLRARSVPILREHERRCRFRSREHRGAAHRGAAQ